MAEVYSRTDATAMLGAAYRRYAHTADATAGKVRTVVDLDGTLDAIANLMDERRQLDYEVVATIGAALTAGANWAQVATITGTSKQGAAQKYRDARRIYASQPDGERGRLDRQAGIASRPIMFEVRSLTWQDETDDDAPLSRHKSAAKAWETARAANQKSPHLFTVYKVWPTGRRVLLVDPEARKS